MFFYNDPTFLLLIPAMLLAFYAQFKVKSTYEKYSKVRSRKGLSGVQVAHNLLGDAGLSNVQVESIPGELSDHYDPRVKKLRLSSGVYNSDSVAALGIVAHEVGHAIQDKQAYAPLALRNNFVPVANLGTTLAFPLFILGMFMQIPMLMDIGIVSFALVLGFQVITLPVEFNASNRAIKVLADGNYLSAEEIPMARSVLNAAALTYIAAAAMSALNLVRLLILRNQRD